MGYVEDMVLRKRRPLQYDPRTKQLTEFGVEPPQTIDPSQINWSALEDPPLKEDPATWPTVPQEEPRQPVMPGNPVRDRILAGAEWKPGMLRDSNDVMDRILGLDRARRDEIARDATLEGLGGIGDALGGIRTYVGMGAQQGPSGVRSFGGEVTDPRLLAEQMKQARFLRSAEQRDRSLEMGQERMRGTSERWEDSVGLRQRGLDLQEARTGSMERLRSAQAFQKDPEVQRGAQTLSKARTIRNLLQNPSAQSDSSVFALLPRLMGEVGNLSTFDQQMHRTRLGYINRIVDAWNRGILGQISDEQRSEILDMVRLMEQAAVDYMRQRQEGMSETYSKVYPNQQPEDIQAMTAPLIPKVWVKMVDPQTGEEQDVHEEDVEAAKARGAREVLPRR